jgi:hypothetical protein
MIKAIGIIALSSFLAACGTANNYTYNGQKYKGEEAFQAAVAQTKTISLASIQKLQTPLTDKKLIAVIPSIDAMRAEILGRFEKQLTRQVQLNEQEIVTNLAIQSYKDLRIFYEAVEQRGIYKSVEIRDSTSTTPSLEASSDYDVLYYSQPNISSGQFFYSSLKFGKQVFAYDLSGGTPQSKVAAFVEAAQALAARN